MDPHKSNTLVGLGHFQKQDSTNSFINHDEDSKHPNTEVLWGMEGFVF